MKEFRSRYGEIWISQDSLPIDFLNVTETYQNTVQVCFGIKQIDWTDVSPFDEILLEMDIQAARDLAEKILEKALIAEQGNKSTDPS